MQFKFGIIVVKAGTDRVTEESQVLHFCGYENDVTDRTVMKELKDELYRELRDDKELNFTEDLKDCWFVICPDELLEYYNEQFKDIEE